MEKEDRINSTLKNDRFLYKNNTRKVGGMLTMVYSKHMIGDKNVFLTLKKERDGSISFGNDNLAKIIGRGIVKLGRKDSKE
jgi:hypothetical protein